MGNRASRRNEEVARVDQTGVVRESTPGRISPDYGVPRFLRSPTIGVAERSRDSRGARHHGGTLAAVELKRDEARQAATPATSRRATPGGTAVAPRHRELSRTVQSVTVQQLIDLSGNGAVRAALRSRAEASISQILDHLEGRRPADLADAHHAAFLASSISRFLDRPAPPATTGVAPAAAPPGSPIGTIDNFLGACSLD